MKMVATSAQNHDAGYQEKHGCRQVQEEACPPADQESLGSLDATRKHKQPAKEQHRDHRGPHGPDNGGKTQQQQSDAQSQEPTPVLDHIGGDSDCQILDLTH